MFKEGFFNDGCLMMGDGCLMMNVSNFKKIKYEF
jgi:hypothetical protein